MQHSQKIVKKCYPFNILDLDKMCCALDHVFRVLNGKIEKKLGEKLQLQNTMCSRIEHGYFPNSEKYTKLYIHGLDEPDDFFLTCGARSLKYLWRLRKFRYPSKKIWGIINGSILTQNAQLYDCCRQISYDADCICGYLGTAQAYQLDCRYVLKHEQVPDSFQYSNAYAEGYNWLASSIEKNMSIYPELEEVRFLESFEAVISKKKQMQKLMRTAEPLPV